MIVLTWISKKKSSTVAPTRSPHWLHYFANTAAHEKECWCWELTHRPRLDTREVPMAANVGALGHIEAVEVRALSPETNYSRVECNNII